MALGQSNQSGLTWLSFALMTVVFWGLYGVLLHLGQGKMADPVNGRYKAFLWVGIAYFLVAVLAPLLVLWLNHATWTMPSAGITWSLLAGVAGGIGAFGVLLAFGKGGTPAVVMCIVFAGAPIVTAVVALLIHPPAGGWSSLSWQFIAGIVLAAAGGCLVTLYRPGAAPPKPAAQHSIPDQPAQS